MSQISALSPQERDFLTPYLPGGHDGQPQGTGVHSSSASDKTMPHVTLTYASSLDSMISLAPGVRTTLSGLETKSMTHYLRLRHDAILIGGGTALVDDPSLNCRYPGASFIDQPRPVIVDPKGRFKAEGSKLCQLASEGKGQAPWVFTAHKSASDEYLTSLGGEHMAWSDSVKDQDEVELAPWRYILTELKRRGIDSVMIEGGAAIINSLITLPEFVDVVVITIAPTWLGNGGVQVTPPSKTADSQPTNAAWLRDTAWRQFGNDAVLCGKFAT